MSFFNDFGVVYLSQNKKKGNLSWMPEETCMLF